MSDIELMKFITNGQVRFIAPTKRSESEIEYNFDWEARDMRDETGRIIYAGRDTVTTLQTKLDLAVEALEEIISTDYKGYDNANAKLRSIAHSVLNQIKGETPCSK